MEGLGGMTPRSLVATTCSGQRESNQATTSKNEEPGTKNESPPPLSPPMPTSPPQLQLTNTYRGCKVFVTGHTGFKGSWLCEWLLKLGAEVTGFSLPGPVSSPSLFAQLGLSDRVVDIRGDLRNAESISKAIVDCDPDFLFHMAAQPLVRLSYDQPVETWQTNVMGTINVLEALRSLATNNEEPGTKNQERRRLAAVMITTDKCYENRECLHGYREEDSLGGYDPYSSSKAAAEIAISSWRRAFFQDHPVKIASARAGNVIGGGDWALDRIVPDSIRALQKGEPIPIRNKTATRPWQHVLEPLSGYLLLASRLSSISDIPTFATSASAAAFNFGPALDSNRTVTDIVQEILKHWPGKWEDQSDPMSPHEAGKLNLATDKAFHTLGWQPRWDFPTTIRKTVDWYRQAESCTSPEDFAALTQKQIMEYSQR